MAKLYKVVDIKTNKQVGGVYKTLRGATKMADRLDLGHGAHRYTTMRIWDN